MEENSIVERKPGSCVPAKYSNIVTNADKVKLVGKNPALIIGFLGTGLVGNIVANQLIEALNMQQIGFVVSDDLPAMAIFIDGVLRHPFRLYYSQENNLIVAICEVPFNKSSRYLDLARSITDWALKIGVKEVCTIQGIPVAGNPLEHIVYVAAELEVINRLIETSGVEKLPRGLVLGPEAEVLNVCMVNQLNGYALLTPVNQQIPSPAGAAAIIEKLNKIYGIDVKTDVLLSEAQKIKDKLMQLNEKTVESHKQIPTMTTLDDDKNLYL